METKWTVNWEIWFKKALGIAFFFSLINEVDDGWSTLHSVLMYLGALYIVDTLLPENIFEEKVVY